jgi:ABC-type amino acid transport substrate-binding protein
MFANGTKSLGQDAWKVFTLDGNGATINFKLYRIDSWDGEAFRVYANDQVALETRLNYANYTQSFSGGGGVMPAALLLGGAGLGSVGGATVGNAGVLGAAAADGTSREWVGTYTDTARVLYTQNRSALTAVTLSETTSNPLDSAAGSNTITATIADVEPTPGSNSGSSEWRVSYDSNGSRSYQINGLRANLSGTPRTIIPSVSRTPDWADNSSFSSAAYPASGSTAAFGSQKGNVPFIQGYTPRPNLETFDSTATGWSTPAGSALVTANSFYSSFMGPFSNGAKTAGQNVWKTFSLNGDGGQISFTMLRFDSWDAENFQVYINDQKLFDQPFSPWNYAAYDATPALTPTSLIAGYTVAISPRNDYSNHNSQGWPDGAFDVFISVPVGVASLKLGFGSNLLSPADDESYGIDNVVVLNASQNPGLYAPVSNNLNLDYIRSTAALANRTLVSSAGRLQTVGTTPTSMPAFLASSGSTSFADAYTKSEGLTVSTTDSAGQSQSFQGFSRLARFNSPEQIAAATTRAQARGGQIIFAVDGYQPTTDNIWRYYDGQSMQDYWGNTSAYIATPTTSWTGARDIAIGYDGRLVKIEDGTENELLDSKFSGANWIGASQASYGASWLWTDGGVPGYANWGAGEPNNSSSTVQIFSNDFNSNATGSGVNRRDNARGSNYGTFLGRFGKEAGWELTIDTANGGGSLDSTYPTTIAFDFLRMDSWDNEKFVLRLEAYGAGYGYAAEGNKYFTGNVQESSFDLYNLDGFRLAFTPVSYGRLGNNSGYDDQTFRVTATLPKGYSSYKLFFDGQTNENHDNEAYGIDNFVVTQNKGEPYAALYDGGQWNDLPPTSSLPGIAEVVVPKLRNSSDASLWQPGEPNDGGGSSTAINEENYLGLYNWLGTFNDMGNSASWYLAQANPVWGGPRSLQETFFDYKYDWTSVAFDLADKRKNFNYAATSVVTPIYEWQPLFHQEDVTIVSTVSRLAPRMVSQPVYVTQPITTGIATSYTTDFRLSSAVPFDSIKANSVTITTTGTAATSLSGNLKATAATTPTTGSANAATLAITSAGALNLGNGDTSAVKTTLVANSLRLQGAGLTVANDLLIVGSNNNQPQSLSLDAGTAALSVQSAIAPVGSLTLRGASLLLPASATSSFTANSLNLAAGATLGAIQPEANAQMRLAIASSSTGAPSSLNLTAGDAITTQDFTSPLPAWTTAGSLSTAPLVGLKLASTTATTALGRFGNGTKTSGQDAWTSVDFKNAGGKFEFDLYRLDSWDGENFVVYANDNAILTTGFNVNTSVTSPITGVSNGYSWSFSPVESGDLGGSGSFTDQRFRVSIKVPAGIGSLKLGLGNTLNQDMNDESYAIDNFLATNDLGQQLANEAFEDPLGGWRQPSTVASSPISINNASIGNVLGVFANGTKTSGQDIWRTFNLSGDGGTISFDLHRLDTWEGEAFSIFANDVVVATSSFNFGSNVSTPIRGSTSGYRYTITPSATASNFYGSTGAGSSYNDQTFRVVLDVPAGVSTLKLGFGSTLDESTANESYAIDNIRFADPGSLTINSLASTLPLVITAGGTVALNAAVSAAALDLTAASLSVSSSTTYSGSGALTLKLTGSSSVDFSSAGSPTFVAPSFRFDSQAGGKFKVNSPTLNLSSPNAISVTQAGTGATSLSLDTAAGFAYTSPGALTVSSLKSTNGNVSLTATTGDINLGSVSQAMAGSLSLTASAGKVVGSSGPSRSIGALTAVARDGVDLTTTQLRSATATTTAAGSDILITAATAGSIALPTLSAPDEIRIRNSEGALELTNPAAISAAKLSLTAQDAIKFATSSSVTLTAANSITLSAKNIDANVDNLTLKTSQAGGTTWLEYNGFSSADAIKLPLIDSANLTFESSSGVRLRSDAFLASQRNKPLSTLTFLRKATSNDLVARRHPYLKDSQLMLGSDNRYYGYSSTTSNNVTTPSLKTHYDSSVAKYTYTALTSSGSGVSSAPINFTSNDFQITAANLANATFLTGVSASQVVLSTVYPVFRAAAAGITVTPDSTTVTPPIADSVSEVLVNAGSSVATGTISPTIPAGYVALQDNDLVRELVRSGYLIANGSSTSSPLMDADVWLDLNRNFVQDSDEPSAITDAYGGFTLAISPSILSSHDSNGDGSLDDEHLRLISIGGTDSLTGKLVPGTVLIGDFGNGVLTPVTTLAALLADAGVPAAQSAAIQRLYGVAVVDVADHSTAYDPYEGLARGDVNQFRQVLAHAQLAGLFLLATTLGEREGLSPVASLQKLAAVVAKVDFPALLADGSPASQRISLLSQILSELLPALTAAQHDGILQVFATVSAEFGKLRAYDDMYRAVGVAVRSLLPASNSLKATLTAVFTEFLPQVLDGSISIEQLQQRLSAQLAGGALDTTALQADHLVSVTPLQQDRLQAGGSANFLISLGTVAPAHGLRLIYSLNAPEGTLVQGANPLSSGSSANGVGEILIEPGLSSTTISLQLPGELLDSISQVSLNLRYSDSGFDIDPNAASAVYLIDGNQLSEGPGLPQPFGEASLHADEITGADGPDLILGGWGADSLNGAAGQDQISGEGGNDVVSGGLGDDQIDGGSGDDHVLGDEGADALTGGIGHDSLSGGSGKDILRGDAGDDHLFGDSGDDKLDGGSGNDLLDGGSGRNILYGNSGADRFLLRAPGSEVDLLLDFNPLEGDQMVVLSSRFPGATASDFAIIGGMLLYRGAPIALVANNGRSYGLISDLAPYLAFTDTPQTKDQEPALSPLVSTANQIVSNNSLTLLPSPGVAQERTQISSAPVLLARDARTNGLQLSVSSGSSPLSASGLQLRGPASAPVLVDLNTLTAESLADSQTTLLLYRVDASGSFLSPDGSRTVASLQAAVIGSIGAVDDDLGRSLFSQGSSQVLLASGQELRFALSRRNRPVLAGVGFQSIESADGITLAISTLADGMPDLLLRASIAGQTAASTEMAIAQKAGLGELLYLNDGETLDISLASSCGNTNTYGFVKLDLRLDAAGSGVASILDASGTLIPVANSESFRSAIRNNLAAGFLVSQGGNTTSTHTWTVSGGSGFYAPVMLSQLGDVYFIGAFNIDGQQHIKPVGDGVFSFEDLSGEGSDFDYNDGVLRLSRRVPVSTDTRSIVFGSALSDCVTYLGSGVNFTAADTAQFIHSNGTGGNLITTGSAADTVVLYGNADSVSLGAGQDRIHLLTGSSDNSIDLGTDSDVDRVFFYRPRGDQASSSLIHFDPAADILSLVNLDSTVDVTFSVTLNKATLLLDNKPMLELIGSFSTDSLHAALRRSDRGAGDALAAIVERGLLVTEMVPGLLGTSQQRSDGQWYGYNVDLARAISEQLIGNADALAILPNSSLLAGLQDVREGYADLGLLGSTSTLSRDVNLGIDFSQPYLVDMQSFLVRGLTSAAELRGQTIGVVSGSTAKDNALAFLHSHGITASITEFATTTALTEALRSGAIAAIASDRTRLMGYQATIPDSALLEETFSIQPLAVALPENQSSLKDAVNWIVQTPAAATELGLSSRELPALLAQAERGGSDLNAISTQTRVFLELDSSSNASGSLGKALGLARGFTQKVLSRLGNAAELWQRHFPMASNIEQNTASDSGQLRSLPFLGQGSSAPLLANDDRGDLLTLVRQRGTLSVATGGNSDNLGFSAPDASGTLQGVDADLARALAIALFGDASRLTFVNNLPFSSTFAAVANGEVDIALRASTANLWRDASLGVDFSDSYLATGLRVLSHSSLGFSRIDQLNGSTIGVIQGTTASQNLKLAFSKTGEAARIVTYADATELYNAFRSGMVGSIARDGALLAGFQQQLLSESNSIPTTMLQGQFSYEPIAAVVDEHQSTFLDLVNSVITILKQAAQLGVTMENVLQKWEEARAANAPAALHQLFQLNVTDNLTSIGITPDRVTDILLTVGNMDQIVQRSIVNADQNTMARSSQVQRSI